jgi:hypothetical protein
MYNFVSKTSRMLPVDRQYLHSLEKRFNISLPKIYKDYYLDHNCKEIHESRFTVNGKNYTVAGMLPLQFGYLNAERIKNMFRSSPAVPGSYFPLAISQEGDNYFLDTESGSVWLLRTDYKMQCEPVTRSLEAFFALMSEHSIKPQDVDLN